MAKRANFLKHTGKDQAKINSETIKVFDQKWADLTQRMCLVSGKVVLKGVRAEIESLYHVNLTDFKIIDEFKNEEIPVDLKESIEIGTI